MVDYSQTQKRISNFEQSEHVNNSESSKTASGRAQSALLSSNSNYGGAAEDTPQINNESLSEGNERRNLHPEGWQQRDPLNHPTREHLLGQEEGEDREEERQQQQPQQQRPLSGSSRSSGETDEVQQRSSCFQRQHDQHISALGQEENVAPEHSARAEKVRPMTLAEKILTHNAIGLTKAEVRSGQIIIVRVARTLASELTLVGINSCLEKLGTEKLWRHDRFLLACDHSVDPRNYSVPHIAERIEFCQSFATKHCLTDYLGPNESILHTEFYKQRVVPGTVVLGADSHTCSHGCVGAFAIGLGASDVAVPLVTGRTWMEVPPSILIEFTGRLTWGLTGKDVILWLLKTYGRNSVALEKCVEFGGALDSLSMDSRFAISNMAVEFGALAGIFPADASTQGFLEERRHLYGLSVASAEGSDSGTSGAAADTHGAPVDEIPMFFRADPEAEYDGVFPLDLSAVRPSVARWPEPDHVFAIDDPRLAEPLYDTTTGQMVCDGITHLDGCFIGACTTAESEFVLAGLLLEAAMHHFNMCPKQRPEKPYKRQATPGSQAMLARLRANGTLGRFEAAGFTVGTPGCSYCLGVGADVAGEGEVWLSSQNRNFRNRMGRGAIGNITSACVVAASSFEMTLTDPTTFLDAVNPVIYSRLVCNRRSFCRNDEPRPELGAARDSTIIKVQLPDLAREGTSAELEDVSGFVQRFGDNVDTDAIIPAQYIPLRGKAQGEKAFAIYKPDFVSLVTQGWDVLVAGEAFGCGSSREEAVSCLQFAGVKAIIAKSFAFIFGRNLLSFNMKGIVIKDPAFYALAEDGAAVQVSWESSSVSITSTQGVTATFPFRSSEIQRKFYKEGGFLAFYKRLGAAAFEEIASHCASVADGSAQKKIARRSTNHRRSRVIKI